MYCHLHQQCHKERQVGSAGFPSILWTLKYFVHQTVGEYIDLDHHPSITITSLHPISCVKPMNAKFFFSDFRDRPSYSV